MKQTLYLYHISQTVNNGDDTYDSAVVAAPDGETAQNMTPGLEAWRSREWAFPSDVKVRLIGKAAFKGEAHVICASFNAG